MSGRVYGIAELEQASGLPRSTIHYYLRRGLLPRPHKMAASRSLYIDDHLRRLRDIAELRAAGLNLVEVEAELGSRRGPVDKAEQPGGTPPSTLPRRSTGGSTSAYWRSPCRSSLLKATPRPVSRRL